MRKEKSNREDYMLCLDGRGRAMVCGCAALLDYSESSITLKLKRKTLTLIGSGLSMTAYYPEDIEVVGEIEEIRIGKG